MKPGARVRIKRTGETATVVPRYRGYTRVKGEMVYVRVDGERKRRRYRPRQLRVLQGAGEPSLADRILGQ